LKNVLSERLEWLLTSEPRFLKKFFIPISRLLGIQKEKYAYNTFFNQQLKPQA